MESDLLTVRVQWLRGIKPLLVLHLTPSRMFTERVNTDSRWFRQRIYNFQTRSWAAWSLAYSDVQKVSLGAESLDLAFPLDSSFGVSHLTIAYGKGWKKRFVDFGVKGSDLGKLRAVLVSLPGLSGKVEAY